MKVILTGCAGFIGSHLLERLLLDGHSVYGFDNFSTGREYNLAYVRDKFGKASYYNFSFVDYDINDIGFVPNGIDVMIHQAALGSVPRSTKDPMATHKANVDGFANMLNLCRKQKVKRIVFASSSSVYGDTDSEVKTEDEIGRPLSYYAASKRINEIQAEAFWQSYGIEYIGLRYFNVFGPRQEASGPFAAVLPKWFNAIKHNKDVTVNGDGSQSRDFTYVKDVVEANMLAAFTKRKLAVNQIYNIGSGYSTDLNNLYLFLKVNVNPTYDGDLVKVEQRKHDVMYSLADIRKACALLKYDPKYNLTQGINEMVEYYK